MIDAASSKDLFVFGIPLVPKRRSANWQRILDNLRKTLNSVVNQTDKNFLCLVASEDLKELSDFSDRRVVFFRVREDMQLVHARDDYHKDNADAINKRSLLALQASQLGSAYFMPLDADDLVSNKIVEVVRKTKPKFGCALTHGFVMDAQNKKILECPSKYIPVRSFDAYCGSSIIYSLKREPDASPAPPRREIAWGHHTVRQRLKEQMTPLDEVALPLVVYSLNTGENISNLPTNDSGRLEFYKSVISQLQAHGRTMSVAQLHEFGLLL